MRKNEGPTADLDPKGLILESYRIEGIGPAECRTIFLAWALGRPEGADMAAEAAALLRHYEAEAPDHPMTALLHEGGTAPRPGRGRGRRARAR